AREQPTPLPEPEAPAPSVLSPPTSPTGEGSAKRTEGVFAPPRDLKADANADDPTISPTRRPPCTHAPRSPSSPQLSLWPPPHSPLSPAAPAPKSGSTRSSATRSA